MSYVNSVLQPGERVIRLGRLHWIVYWHAILLAVLAVLFAAWGWATGMGMVMSIVATAFGVLAVVSFVYVWFIRWTTEIAVTDRRFIYKYGFINRHTVEVNMDKVAGVDVDQSILGRVFSFGTIIVRGTGGSLEPIRLISDPLTFRSHITAS